MITVLVANSKGGCGKTTIATHLAAAFAGAGLRAALADADRQGSSLGWLRARPDGAAPIQALDWRDGPDGLPEDRRPPRDRCARRHEAEEGRGAAATRRRRRGAGAAVRASTSR
jgi:cellulose biosynthesis protein BcsQ